MTVTVGFAPATTPGPVTGGAPAGADSGAPEGLFAALLAMLAPGQTTDATADNTADAVDKVTAADFAALIKTLAAEATSPAKQPEAAEGEPEEADAAEDSSETTATANKLEDLSRTQGKSLLKDLGDALIALNDSVEAGQPVDPALERKLNEAVDALAIYLGALTPTSTPTTRIRALASGDGAIPAAGDPLPAPAAPAVPAPAAAVPAEVAPATAAPEANPTAGSTDAADAPEPFVVAERAPDGVDASDATIPQPAPAKGATTLEQAPPALRQLGLVIGKLSEKLAARDPELTKKLDALAETLKSATLPDALKAGLGQDAAATERELKRIVEALATPKPAAAKPAEAKTFSPPTLELPQAVVAPAKKDEFGPAVAAVPDPAPKLEPSEPELARPIAAATTTKAEKPEAADSKPAPAAAQPSQPQPATADPAAAAAQQTQPAAVPGARTIHAAYQAPVQQVNLPQVAFEVVRQFEAGNTRFQIRLDPPELGRIDVKLDVDKSGTVNARLTVERPETLDLMQRDQRALQQALQQAGLDGQKTNLEFSLRQNPFAQQGGMGDGRGEHPGFNGRGDSFAGSDEVATEAATTTYRGTASASGLNLFV